MGKRLSAEEIIEEYLWLRSFGISPIMVCKQMDRKPESTERLFWEKKQVDLALELQADRKLGRRNDSA